MAFVEIQRIETNAGDVNVADGGEPGLALRMLQPVVVARLGNSEIRIPLAGEPDTGQALRTGAWVFVGLAILGVLSAVGVFYLLTV